MKMAIWTEKWPLLSRKTEQNGSQFHAGTVGQAWAFSYAYLVRSRLYPTATSQSDHNMFQLYMQPKVGCGVPSLPTIQQEGWELVSLGHSRELGPNLCPMSELFRVYLLCSCPKLSGPETVLN